MNRPAAGPSRADLPAVLACVLLFAAALGAAAVALPLRALAAGYDAAAVGFLGAFGAAAQIAARALLPWVLRRVPDRWLIRGACGLMAVSGTVLVGSGGLAAFAAAAGLLGVARALFWTGSQVHVLRGHISGARRRLSYLQFTSATGEFIGPLAGGFAAQWTLDAGLWFWALCGLAGLAPGAFLARFAPFAPADRTTTTPVWRQPGVVAGSAAVGAAGGWRGLLSSLVPAVLAEAGRSAGQIGVLLALANGTTMLGSLAAGRVPSRWVSPAVSLAIVVTGLGLGAAGLVADAVVVAGAALVISGLGSGLLQTLGTVLAAAGVHEDRRGDVVVLVGLVRSVALMALPAGVAVLAGALTAPVALAVGGGLLAAPVAIRWGRPR
jgi:hypothetical protein